MNDREEALHVRAAQGTESVAWELDRQFRERLCALVDREMNTIHKRRQDPEDVVQSVFMSFYRRAAKDQYRFEHTGALWKLLQRIARNKMLNRVDGDLAGKRDVRRETDNNPALLAEKPLSAAQARLFGEALELALNGMDAPAPEIFRLQLYGYTIAEIVEIVLQDLEAPYPEILQMRLQGHSEQEIADAMNCGREAVRYRLDRIQERLRHLLRENSQPD